MLKQINEIDKCPKCKQFKLKSKKQIIDEFYRSDHNSSSAIRFSETVSKVKWDYICENCGAEFKDTNIKEIKN